MKWDAASMRRSAVVAEVAGRGDVAGVGGDAGQRVEGEDLDVGVVGRAGRSSRIAASRSSAPACPIADVHGGQQALAERGLFAASGGAVPRGRRFEGRPRSCDRRRARAGRARGGPGRAPRGVRRRWPRPCRSRARGWRRRRRSRRPGTALVRGWTAGTPRSAGSRAGRDVSAARPRWTTASSKRCWMRASSPSTASPRTCSHGSSTVSQPVLDLIDGLDAARLVAGGDRGAGGEEPVGGLIPRPVQPLVERVAAIGQLERVDGTRRGATRRRRGSTQHRACRSTSLIASASSVAAAMWSSGELEATGRRFDPRGEQQRVGPVAGRGGVAGRVERGQDPLRASAVTEDDPGPAEPVDEAERDAAGRARCSRPARRRCWRARPGRRRGARLGGCCAPRRSRIAAASANQAACAAKARSDSPASVIASSANARMLSSSR